jgi:hypothetical protein
MEDETSRRMVRWSHGKRPIGRNRPGASWLEVKGPVDGRCQQVCQIGFSRCLLDVIRPAQIEKIGPATMRDVADDQLR